MTQQTERDEALIAEKKRLADELERMYNGAWAEDAVTLRHAAALLRGDKPAKPDLYIMIGHEVWNKYKNEGPGAAAAVLRRHFEPSAEVVEAAKKVESLTNSCGKNTFCSSARTLADFILKGDQ